MLARMKVRSQVGDIRRIALRGKCVRPRLGEAVGPARYHGGEVEKRRGIGLEIEYNKVSLYHPICWTQEPLRWLGTVLQPPCSTQTTSS